VTIASPKARRATKPAPAHPRAAPVRNSPFRPGPPRDRSNHDQIVRTLGEEILAGVHAPGENLPPEPDLLRRFGVSRTVLREVLKTLGAKGMVIAKARVGTRVLDAQHWNFFDRDVVSWKVAHGADKDFRRSVAEIRRALEPAAARLAALHRSPAEIEAMRAEIAAMRAATTALGYAEADLRLHLIIGAASGNPLMRSLAAVIEAALMEAFTMSPPVRRPRLQQQTTDGHEAIVDAIAMRNGPAAAQAMVAVIDAGFTRIERERAAGKRRKTPS